jgi:hypothetical protein
MPVAGGIVPSWAGDPVIVLSNTVVFMANIKYTLAAWTENGQIRMVPSLVNELSVPYREKIERLDEKWNVDRSKDEEVGWILARSRAHEEFARFLLRVGYPKEAFEEYGNAAQVCLLCSDRLWLQGPRGDFPVLPLYHRFHAMHRKAWLLTRENPVLKSRYEGGELKGLYLWMTIDEREWDEEFDQALETLKVWRFGRIG